MMLIREILTMSPGPESVEVNGWVRTRRDAKDISFIEVNDGSCLQSLQIVADFDMAGYESIVRKLSTGCSVRFKGILRESPAPGQKVELEAQEVEVYGWAPASRYPLQKKRHSFEFLREIPHLRGRTNSIGAVMRIRSSLALACHVFMRDHGFFQIHAPVITTSDCEGAGEMFTVTTLQPDNFSGSNPFAADFFGQQAGLSVSGQLEAEAYAQALGRVYTFGPTFRAENSNTSRHLAEFWMIEPEMAFCDLEMATDLAEQFMKFLVSHVLDSCPEDLALFEKFVDRDLRLRLETVVSGQFARISYDEAIDILQNSGQSFAYPVSWGVDLQSEHERFLTEQVMKRPTVVSDYPAAIKPFYMRANADGKTVAAMDILFPSIGEMVGGSQREERYDLLKQKMQERELDLEKYRWYLELRAYGSVPHAGFGLGFERFVQFVTGMANIRDVIPFPRTPGKA